MKATFTSCSFASCAGAARDGAASRAMAATAATPHRRSSRAAAERTMMAGKSFTVATSKTHGDLAVDRTRHLGRRRVDQFRREFEVSAVEQVFPDERQLDAVG